MALPEEMALQIAFADVLLLNKIDCLQAKVVYHKIGIAESIRLMTDYLAHMNGTACIHVSSKCEINADEILERGTLDAARVAVDLWMRQSTFERQTKRFNLAKTVQGYKNYHTNVVLGRHTAGIRTISFSSDICVDLALVEKWLESLLWTDLDEESNKSTHSPETCFRKHGKAHYFRIKGVLNVQNQSRRYVIQAVREMYEVNEGTLWNSCREAPKELKRNKIVIIGLNIGDSESFRQSFETSCKANVENVH